MKRLREDTIERQDEDGISCTGQDSYLPEQIRTDDYHRILRDQGFFTNQEWQHLKQIHTDFARKLPWVPYEKMRADFSYFCPSSSIVANRIAYYTIFDSFIPNEKYIERKDWDLKKALQFGSEKISKYSNMLTEEEKNFLKVTFEDVFYNRNRLLSDLYSDILNKK